jgi:transcriptional regulator with XRE-family HTH domain
MRRRTIKDDGPDPIDRYVGSRVRARRVGIRLSQTKLGEAIGVTFQQVQKYERGANRVSASKLHAIGTALSAPVAYFFEGFAMHEYPDVPEYAASHGCVRVPAGDAAAVFEFTELGMPVFLYHSS